MDDNHHVDEEYSCDDESTLSEKEECAGGENKAKHHQNQSQSYLQQFRGLRVDRKIEVIIAIVGLTFAGILTWATIRQLGAMKQQTTMMQGQYEVGGNYAN